MCWSSIPLPLCLSGPGTTGTREQRGGIQRSVFPFLSPVFPLSLVFPVAPGNGPFPGTVEFPVFHLAVPVSPLFPPENGKVREKLNTGASPPSHGLLLLFGIPLVPEQG